jgi:MOSC domain-containing protein YiiM
MSEATVVAIFTAPEKHVPLVSRDEVNAVAGRGLEGDRYFNAEGWDEPKREITLVELEAVEAANRDYDLGLTLEDMRRQIVTKGIALNHLVDREFTVGDVRCRGVKLNEPCNHLRKLADKPLIKPMIHRGGLRAQILESGTIRVGDPIRSF